MGGNCNRSSDCRPRRARATARLAGVVLVALVAGVADGQEVQPPLPAEPPPAAQPGFLDALGRWLDDSKAKLDNQIKSTTDAAKDAARAAEAAGQATGAMLRWPGAQVVQGRVRCAVAQNGAADCAEAAHALCRSKGFTAGKSIDINTAQKCPTWVWLSGRPAPEGACTTETFVLRATCQ